MTEARRLDLLHVGTPSTETYVITGVHAESQADAYLPGTLDVRGEYRWSVISPEGSVLASRGFSAFFGEWQSTVTGETGDGRGEFPETHVVPWHPAARLRIERRVSSGRYQTVFEVELAKCGVAQPSRPNASGERVLRRLHGRGGVHFLVVSEGYAAAESERFFDDAQRVCDTILAASPYRDLARSLSVSALLVPCRASGIPCAPGSSEDSTNFATAYGTLGMPRYLVPTDLHALREATAGIPHTSLVVLANSGDYGGCGIFNSQCWVPANMSPQDFKYVLLHELGHSLGGLADEYFARPVPYSTEDASGWTPWEPNVSPLDENGRVKWSSRIAPDVPVPTPWSHAEYLELMRQVDAAAAAASDDASRTSAEAARRREAETRLLASEPYRGRLGAFEGALYRAFGMYRPEVDCRMFSKTADAYCTICSETIRQAIAMALEAPMQNFAERR